VRVTCAACSTETTVPFKPRNGKPVLCYACFKKANQAPIPKVNQLPITREPVSYAL
jgi:CxxC-x17-CxxC domain-containing protein